MHVIFLLNLDSYLQYKQVIYTKSFWKIIHNIELDIFKNTSIHCVKILRTLMSYNRIAEKMATEKKPEKIYCT